MRPGIIPADAGSTKAGACGSCIGRDYPRGCGEHTKDYINRIRKAGSSPRMRGAPPLVWPVLCLIRIIPADAGSTVLDKAFVAVGQDHPRGCGEHRLMSEFDPYSSGSSPRMRGAPTEPRASDVSVRIIPADAGSTSHGYMTRYGTGDHPRGCGEHVSRVGFERHVVGSSPRMRGAPGQRRAGRVRRGIIPADAGSTCWPSPHQQEARDHPRGCGEHGCVSYDMVSYRGSSPRMRGAHLEILAIPTIQ